MTGLLVSVRSMAEAGAAVPYVDLLDVKEPAHGPLGAADPGVIAEILSRAPGELPVSAALGELLDLPDGLLKRLPPGLRFAKLGLAGCSARSDWPALWAAAIGQFAQGVTPVAVAYADWRGCGAPSPADVLETAAELNCGAALLDTYDKSSGGLLEHLAETEARRCLATAREQGLTTVVAGSLTVETIPRVLPWQPDYIAVRGAACRGSRGGAIDARRVRALAALVHGNGLALAKSPNDQ